MRAIRIVLWLLVVLPAGILSWGLLEPYFYEVVEEQAVIDELPERWEGERFAQISDWQVGMWLSNTATMAWLVEYLVAERPAFVLFTGDFVAYVHAGTDDADEALATVASRLSRLAAAGIPVYGVLGNHDYEMNTQTATPVAALAEQVRAVLGEAGVIFLQNDAVPLIHPRREPAATEAARVAEALYLVGVGAHWPERDDVDAALERVPERAARIVMMHHPDSFIAFPEHTAPLAVAGHTHGGQIRLPFMKDWSWMSWTQSDDVHADGWSDGQYGESGNRLYINRGIGFSTLPLRINCRPEVTMFTLRGVPSD